MKTTSLLFKQLRASSRDRGLALITVLSILALITVMVVAFFSLVTADYKSSQTDNALNEARRLGNMSVNIVAAQLQNAVDRTLNNSGRPVIHATQPGAARTYDETGTFIAGYKLHSAANMIYRGKGSRDERDFVKLSELPSDWATDKNAARFVDLNSPVVRAKPDGSGVDVFFPIIDPRASVDADAESGDHPVEGFSYTTATAINGNNMNGGGELETVVLARPGNLDEARLAMPVEWLYILQDGGVGVLDDSFNFVEAPGSSKASTTNPIVGRIAFWADDECCKINVNTASDQTFSGKPVYYHAQDKWWADRPPAYAEYQRFAGHPATVALSSVLYPNGQYSTSGSFNVDNSRNSYTYGTSAALATRLLSYKNSIYELAPRIHTGGSQAGTVIYSTDDYDVGAPTTTAVAIRQALKERLFPNVQELMFASPYGSGGSSASGSERSAFNAGTGNVTLFDQTTLQRVSAFLTAHSRGSDVSLFGTPKISMWPVAAEARGANSRTAFDNMSAFASQIGGRDYFFRRALSMEGNASTLDVTLIRNQALLNYLDAMLVNQTFPGGTFTGRDGSGGTFASNYGVDNVRQLIVAIFDYIRCTNLYDNLLAPDRDAMPQGNIAQTLSSENQFRHYNPTELYNLYRLSDEHEVNNTFTRPFAKDDDTGNNAIYADYMLPGHGQVTPSRWVRDGKTYQGYGRFVTLSEVGLHFICTADGQNDKFSWRIPEREAGAGRQNNFRFPIISDADLVADERFGLSQVVSGGRTALQVSDTANILQYPHETPRGFNGGRSSAAITNSNEVDWSRAGSGQIVKRYYSNFAPLTGKFIQGGLYGTRTAISPPSSLEYGRNTTAHPGYEPENWNYTLEPDTPLKLREKRIQGAIQIELNSLMMGFNRIFPEFTVVVDGRALNAIRVQDAGGNMVPIFASTTDVVVKSYRNIFYDDQNQEVGGPAGFQRIAQARLVGQRGKMDGDGGYDEGNRNRDGHVALQNYDLIGGFVTIDGRNPMRVSYAANDPMVIKIYDSHDYLSRDPVQTIEIGFPQESTIPAPDLVVMPSYRVEYKDNLGRLTRHEEAQAPRWWTFNSDGCVGRRAQGNGLPSAYRTLRGRLFTGLAHSRGPQAEGLNPRYNGVGQPSSEVTDYGRSRQKQRLPRNYSLIYTKSAWGTEQDGVILRGPEELNGQPERKIEYGFSGDSWLPLHYGTDVVRSIMPRYGDVRVVAGKNRVPRTDWVKHPDWDNPLVYAAHNSSNGRSQEPGFDFDGASSTSDYNLQFGFDDKVTLGAGFNYSAQTYGQTQESRRATTVPDSLMTPETVKVVARYGDFSDGPPGYPIGPWLNKPDEGSQTITRIVIDSVANIYKNWRSSYYDSGDLVGQTVLSGGQFFSPNRLVSSPVMFGSLSTGVYETVENNTNLTGAWRTLLFRPHVRRLSDSTAQNVVGAIWHQGQGGVNAPPDHYLLELFRMPIVEPYAISDPTSTAGKINLNYQMLPFTHIRRATGLHAAMKGEIFHALPVDDYAGSRTEYRSFYDRGDGAPTFWSENDTGAFKVWHRSIVVDKFPGSSEILGTLLQFDERFSFSNLRYARSGGLFRTASQICEVHLIPSDNPVAGAGGTASISKYQSNVNRSKLKGDQARIDAMSEFWTKHAATGDNTREAPYASLYQKVTTRSNVFRVHFRAQTLRKARSSDSTTFDVNKDKVAAEYRGNVLLERYIDPSDKDIPDYAVGNAMQLPSLESFYKFRVLESKRFAP
ncbi:MAG: Verru_Chthon cassette protein A [Verrucomicrobiales bacterium]|nr:Verru_Chthon cassette protein A [Verrucomicrobiales bacterium]